MILTSRDASILIPSNEMPGPSNSSIKRKRKSRGKDNNRKQNRTLLLPAQPQLNHDLPTTNTIDSESNPPSPPSSPYLRTPSPLPYQLQNLKEVAFSLDDHVPKVVEETMFKQPFIHDPGNGPRVRIAKDFISSFFAQPPAFDVSYVLVIPLHHPYNKPLNDRTHYALNLHKKKFYKCFARYCQRKLLWWVNPSMTWVVLKLYCQKLLWYNKSRARSRVCPACQRLYRLGDVLPDHMEEEPRKNRPMIPQLLREQEISGLCMFYYTFYCLMRISKSPHRLPCLFYFSIV